ncbi:MAG TPA: YqgE/AlgH family protein [Mycobacteriales bacterium]|nr:YqgE/AlgH family protein [Mycobacteriales bacterium]
MDVDPVPGPAADPHEVAGGRLLVATPLLTEPTFARAVVLLLQAGGDDGALGVVLNRPTGTEVERVLPGWGVAAPAPAVVFEGGPVQPQAAICLAELRPAAGPQEGLALLPPSRPGPRRATVDLDAAPEDLLPAIARLRVFAGYAGWSPGQLEAEVAEGAWWVVDPLPDDVYRVQPQELWRTVLRRQGPPLAFAVTLPDDATLN